MKSHVTSPWTALWFCDVLWWFILWFMYAHVHRAICTMHWHICSTSYMVSWTGVGAWCNPLDCGLSKLVWSRCWSRGASRCPERETSRYLWSLAYCSDSGTLHARSWEDLEAVHRHSATETCIRQVGWILGRRHSEWRYHQNVSRVLQISH